MLFESSSYQHFLRDELLSRIRLNPRYSQRAFARDLGVSAGELSEAMRGKRSMSRRSLLSIAGSLGLNETETRHLFHLANQEKVGQMADPPRITSNSNLAPEIFAIVSNWYCFRPDLCAAARGHPFFPGRHHAQR